jgi:hypothetical protein
MTDFRAWCKANYANTCEFWTEFANRYVELARQDETLKPQLEEICRHYEKLAETANQFEDWM